MGTIVECGVFIIVACWALLLVQSHRLVQMFVSSYPEIAKDKIPYAFERFADPGKILFFFKKENLQLLKENKDIWRLRQQTKILIILSAVLPVLGIVFLTLAIYLTQAG